MITNFLNNIKNKLTKTSSKINDALSNIFIKKKLDQKSLDDLEELLLSCDIGVNSTEYIINNIKKDKFDSEIDQNYIQEHLAKLIEDIIKKVEKPIEINSSNQLEIILVAGVNGGGKTTTIGKLANRYKQQGKKVAVAACDTFRAAAIEQLKIWADRSDIRFIQGNEGSDPASVAYQAVDEARKNNIDILLIDTAGRLHNKANLMEELSKIVRVIKKLIPEAPHQNLLVLDATTGQNAHLQVESFNKILNITGLIITKLDGTAKAGVLIAIADKFKIPVLAIGVGENIDDLKEFNANIFARNLVGLE